MSAKESKHILMQITTRQIKELVKHYRLGFQAFEPDADSMENIEICALELLGSMVNATFVKVERKLHYAKRDVKFQTFLSRLRGDMI